jgi:hypothetical protein
VRDEGRTVGRDDHIVEEMRRARRVEDPAVEHRGGVEIEPEQGGGAAVANGVAHQVPAL